MKTQILNLLNKNHQYNKLKVLEFNLINIKSKISNNKKNPIAQILL